MEIIEKIFQVIFVIVMAIGILGLPAYFVLNARRKRISAEYYENNDENNDETDETDKNDEK